MPNKIVQATRTNNRLFVGRPLAVRNPLLVRRGGREAAGVVVRAKIFGVSDHPVCGAKVGFAEIFLMPQPPLLTRRGLSSLNSTKHTVK